MAHILSNVIGSYGEQNGKNANRILFNNNNLFQGKTVLRACDKNLKATLKLAEEMIELAGKGDADREDVGCGILYGILLDSAYKIKGVAENEKRSHVEKGWWDKG